MSSPSQETQEAQQTEEAEDTEEEQESESHTEYGPRVNGMSDTIFRYSVNEESPFVVVPRGGAKEIGRSCYQVETRQGTYLVDVGLNQGDGGLVPDLRGLENGQIDAVFPTHAHIDHVGSLPLLESYGLLSRQAPVITTRPTSTDTQCVRVFIPANPSQERSEGMTVACGWGAALHGEAAGLDPAGLHWGQGRAVWNNSGDTVTLTDDNGEEVDVYQY